MRAKSVNNPAMSCKKKKGKSVFLFVATIYFNTFLVCCSGSSGQSEDDFTASTGWERIRGDKDEQQGHWHADKAVIRRHNQRRSDRLGLHKLRPDSADSLREPLSDFSLPKLSKTLSWTIGNASKEPRTSAADTEDGYQADFTGFPGVQGKLLGLSSGSSPLSIEWEAMRPLVECDDNVMFFTASGQGFRHLLVDREGASPISVFQLPPYCGYSVKLSWNDLEMMVPYDACYITQENGSYILPLLWWGSPLKLSCPIQMSTPSPTLFLSTPAVFCSPYGMSVHIHGQEQDIPVLGVLVNGAWGPFVSEQCAYHVDSQSLRLIFFIPSSAPCITLGDDLNLQLILDDQEYILSCPVGSVFRNAHSPPWSPPLFPGKPQSPHILDPVSPAPTSAPPPPPQPPTQKQIAQLPDNPRYRNPGLPRLPWVDPPGPQHHRPPQPTPASPPGPQQQLIYPTGTGKLSHSLGGYLKFPSRHYQPPVILQATSAPDFSPVQDHAPHQAAKLPVGLSQYPFGVYYPHVPFYYPAVTPALTPEPPQTTTTTVPPATQLPKLPASPYYPSYKFKIPYYPAPSAASETPAPSPPPSPPKQPVGPYYHHSPFDPSVSYNSYYSHWSAFYPKPSASHPTTAPPPSPTVTTTDSPSYPSTQFYLQKSLYLPLPPAKEKPQKPVPPQAICPPYTHTICGYYSHPYYPYYHTLYPPHYHPVPQYPEIQPPMTAQMPTTTTTTPSFTTPALPTPDSHDIQCQTGWMAAFLPFAHPDSIQVRDQMKTWLPLSTVSPLCGYMRQMAEGAGVILYSPLPACHSQLQTPTTFSLPVRFWDTSSAQYKTVDLNCPYQSTLKPPAPLTPFVPPTPPSITKATVSPYAVPNTEVVCSPHQMIVELPSGSISGIVVKDIKGNHQMKLQEAPKHCGYSASKLKDGKIRLSLQLHSRCHMSVQGKMHIISIIYMTAKGRKEEKFSCPVVIPGSGQECNLPSEQRLSCGSSSVSQPQCLSMGCCFNKHPPACYYPMDECTIDRHFVFSVPASLTEPPLSPALLVAASNSTCKPVKVTADYALFKIPMDGCGTRRVVVGKTVVYMLEVINKVQTISLNYGTITRDSPVRLLVECRFVPGTVLTVSYVVKTPTLGPQIHTQGAFGVQLRIAKDAQYSSYYPQYHQPLQMLLGKPLYLEVRLLNSPDPSLVLLVHFCVAYPRSGKAVWVLLYNGCPNPLDPASPQTMLSVPQPPSPQGQIRRFTISTFQFLPDGEFKDPNEEIYFMCSTEICSPRDGPCVEGCFGQ